MFTHVHPTVTETPTFMRQGMSSPLLYAASRTNRVRGWITNVLVGTSCFVGMVCYGTPLRSDEKVKASSTAVASTIDPAQIERWIEELGNPSYRVRQEAFMQLWQSGPQAAPMVERSAKSGDLSVVSAAKWLLLLQRLGSQADVGDAIQNLGFIQAGDIQTILRLARDKRWNQVLGMLQLLSEEQRASLINDVPSRAPAALISLALQDNQEAIVPTLINYVYPPVQASAMRRLWTRAGIQVEDSRGVPSSSETLLPILELEWQGDIDSAVRRAREADNQELAQFILRRNFRWSDMLEAFPNTSPEGVEQASREQLESLTRTALLNDWCGKGEVAATARQAILNSNSDDALAMGTALIAIGEVQKSTEAFAEQSLSTAFQIKHAIGDIDQAFKIVGLESLEPNVFDAWLLSRTKMDNRDNGGTSELTLVAMVGVLLGQIGHHEQERQLNDALARLAEADVSQDQGRWDDLFRVWASYDHRETMALYLAKLFERGSDRDLIDRYIEQYYPKLSLTGPDILHYLKRISNNQSWLETLQELEMLEQGSLPTRLRDPVEFDKMATAILNSQRSRNDGLRFANEPEGDFDREFKTETIAKLAYRVGFLEIAEKLQRPQVYSSTFFAELLAARGRIELGAVVMGNLFYNRFPNRNWMAFQQSDWLKQLGRVDDANLARRHALLIPCNDVDNLESLEEYGLKEDHLMMIEHFYSTCEPDAGRNRFAVNELIWAASKYAGLVEETDPVLAANLYRVSQYDLASFLRFPTQPIILLESEQLCLARQAIAANDRDKADQHFRRAFAVRPNNIDAAIKLVPLAEKSFGKEVGETWYKLHEEHHLKHLERWPDDAMVHNNLAWLMAKLDRNLPEAQKHAVRATELKKNESTYLDTLGEVEFRLGNVDRAIELAMQCIQLNGMQKSYRQQLTRFTTAKFNKSSSGNP